MNKISAAFCKIGYKIKKHSPVILTVTAIFSSAAAIVMCGLETYKFQDKVAAPLNKKIKEIDVRINNKKRIANNEEEVDLTNENKEKRNAYLKAGFNFIKLYSPTIILFAVSATSMIGSTKIMASRNMALAAAYGTLKESYDAYRDRVRISLGEEKEKAIHEGSEKEKHQETKMMLDDAKVPAKSDFTVLYCEGCDGWEKNAQMNLDYLLAKQAYLNQKLRICGFLFMSDVYKELGIDEDTLSQRQKQASHVVGWLYDPKDHSRDSYISFGLTDSEGHLTKKALNMAMNGERNVWIELNPDGDILTGNHNKRTFVETLKKGAY